MKKIIVNMFLSLVLLVSAYVPAVYGAIEEGDKINVPTPANVKIDSRDDIGQLIANAITAILSIAGLLTFAFLIWGGIQWITSGGDKAQYEAARNRITYALVGLAIVAAAWALMKIIANFFGLDDFTSIVVPEFKP